MKKWKIAVCVVLLAVISFSVFMIGGMVHEAGVKTKLAATLSKVSNARAGVEQFFGAEAQKLELADNEQQIVTEFESARDATKSAMSELLAMEQPSGEKVKTAIGEVKEAYKNYEKAIDLWDDTKLLLDPSDDNLAKLAKSNSDYLKNLGKELVAYRKDAADFKEKYANAKGSSELIVAYSEIQIRGDELIKKYENVKLGDILGTSGDAISTFYEKIEKLNEIVTTH